MSIIEGCAKHTGHNESKVFMHRFVPFEHLFDFTSVSVINCYDMEKRKPVTVGIHQMTEPFDHESVVEGGFYESSVAELIEVVCDEEAKLYFTISEIPKNAYTITEYVENQLKNDISAIRKAVSLAMRQMLLLFMGMVESGYVISHIPMNGVLLEVNEKKPKLFQMKLAYNLLEPGVAELKHFKMNLITVATMFSDLYYNANPKFTTMTPREYEFFHGCSWESPMTILDLWLLPYIQSNVDDDGSGQYKQCERSCCSKTNNGISKEETDEEMDKNDSIESQLSSHMEHLSFDDKDKEEAVSNQSSKELQDEHKDVEMHSPSKSECYDDSFELNDSENDEVDITLDGFVVLEIPENIDCFGNYCNL